MNRGSKTQRKNRGRLIRVIVVICLLLLVICSLGLISQKESMRLATSIIDGEQTLSEEDIRDVLIDSVYSHHFPFFFSPSNIYLVSPKQIEARLAQAFPRIETVDIIKDISARSLHVTLTERRGSLLYCGDANAVIDEVPKCQFLNDRGVVFDDAPQFTGSPYLRVYKAGALPIILGQQLFKPEEIIRLEGLKEVLEAMLSVDVFAIEVGEEHQYTVFLETPSHTIKNATIVRLVHDETFDQQLKNLALVVDSPSWKSSIAHVTDLLYIDLRFDSRVIYKPRVDHVVIPEKIIPIE